MKLRMGRSPAMATSGVIGQQLALNLISVAATAYLIRELGAYDFGQWATAAVLLGTLSFLPGCGLRPVFVRRVAQRAQDLRARAGDQLIIRCSLSAAVGAVALLIGFLLSYPTIVVLCIAVNCVALLLTNFSLVTFDMLHGDEAFGHYSLICFVSGLMLTVCSVVVVWLGGGPVLLSVSYLVGPALNCIGGFHAISIRGMGFSVEFRPPRLLETLRESKSWFAENVTAAVRDKIENVVAPAVIGLEGFGHLSAGTLPVSRLLVVPDSLATTAYPVISRRSIGIGADGDRASVALVRLCFSACLPIAVVVSEYAGLVAGFLFPSNAEMCALIMRVSIWGLPLMAVQMAMSGSLLAAGEQRVAARASILSTALSVPVVLALLWKFGAPGAAAAWPVRGAIMLTTLWVVFVRHMDGRKIAGALFWISVAGAASSAALHFIRSVGWGWWAEPPALVVFGVMYVGALWVAGEAKSWRELHSGPDTGGSERDDPREHVPS